MSDNLSDMKKIPAREFQRSFGKIAESMAEGQRLEITMHGKPIGHFTKQAARKLRVPDFASMLDKEGFSPDFGDQLLKEFNESLS